MRGADARVVVRDELERVGILRGGVDAEGYDHAIRRELADGLDRRVEGGCVTRPVGAGREREVPRVALARAPTPLGGEAEEVRIVVGRIGVQRDEEHVVAVVEELLGPVPVMEIDVEDRDARADVGPGLRRDGGVVEVAVARERVGGRVVSRWPAEPVHARASGASASTTARHAVRATSTAAVEASHVPSSTGSESCEYQPSCASTCGMSPCG